MNGDPARKPGAQHLMLMPRRAHSFPLQVCCHEEVNKAALDGSCVGPHVLPCTPHARQAHAPFIKLVSGQLRLGQVAAAGATTF